MRGVSGKCCPVVNAAGEIRASMGLGARKRAKEVTPRDVPNMYIPEDVPAGTTPEAFLASLVRCPRTPHPAYVIFFPYT